MGYFPVRAVFVFHNVKSALGAILVETVRSEGTGLFALITQSSSYSYTTRKWNFQLLRVDTRRYMPDQRSFW